ncbi:2-aminoadipate transaminase [Streptomyces antimycoticus]
MDRGPGVRRAGRPVDAAQVLLTHGSQQGLDLLCKALLDPDVVFVDRPSYVGALQVFRLFQARVVDLPLGSDERFSTGSAAPSVGGTGQNHLCGTHLRQSEPGATLDTAHRRRLAALAQRYGCVLVEDDPYRDLGYDTVAPRPAAATSTVAGAVRMGTFSKVLFPAARLGHLILPPFLTDVLMKFKQAADLGNSLLMQQVVQPFLNAATPW